MNLTFDIVYQGAFVPDVRDYLACKKVRIFTHGIIVAVMLKIITKEKFPLFGLIFEKRN